MVIFGFILRFDHYGVSSFIRWLGLLPSMYPSLLHFFRAGSWQLGEVMLQWMTWSRQAFDFLEINGRLVCAGDGIKISKEAKKQPGLKKLHNASQNQNKPKSFIGHHFGCIAFIAVAKMNFRAILQAAQLHEGVDVLRKLEASENKAMNWGEHSVVTRMVSLLIAVAIRQKKPLLACLDAYFSTTPAFILAASYCMDNGKPWVQIVTRAKSSYVAFVTRPLGKKKVTFKLTTLFQYKDWFNEADHPLHPERKVLFYCEDLYWGPQALLLRFVWVIDQGRCFVLMSSDRTLEPLAILKVYGLRSLIEVSFRVLKHIIGGFAYRFWSKLWPVSNKENLPIQWKKDNPIALKALQTLKAIERFVNLGIIAQGILSYFALKKTATIWHFHHAHSWLRTYSSPLPSEEVVQRILQGRFLSTTCSNLYTWIKHQASNGLPCRKMCCSRLENKEKVREISSLPYFLTD